MVVINFFFGIFFSVIIVIFGELIKLRKGWRNIDFLWLIFCFIGIIILFE